MHLSKIPNSRALWLNSMCKGASESRAGGAECAEEGKDVIDEDKVVLVYEVKHHAFREAEGRVTLEEAEQRNEVGGTSGAVAVQVAWAGCATDVE